MSLFRKEALSARRHNWLGSAVIAQPLPLTVLTLVAAGFALAVLAMLVWGSYTQRATVQGRLVPEGGLLRLYAHAPATVVERLIEEGQKVDAGQALYVLSIERETALLGETQAAIAEQLRRRQDALQGEITQTRRLQQQEARTLQASIATLREEIRHIDQQMALQRSRIALARETVGRYEGLLRQDYISREELQRQQEALLDQRALLQSLERERASLLRQAQQQESELAGLEARHANQISELSRALAALEQERLDAESQRSQVITAPRDGVVTALLAQVGQTVNASQPLLSIVPDNARLYAELYAPSVAIGFVRPGDRVRLRFDAYPYQKFGHHEGIVQTVARTALAPEEWDRMRPPGVQPSSAEPLYRIQVSLADQHIVAYGESFALQPGMTLEADVLQESLRLYEWALAPLRTLSGKL